MTRNASYGAALLAALAFAAACPKKAPPPAPPPPMCARVERGGDEIVEEVRCSGKDVDEDGVDDAVDNCPDLLEVPNGTLDKDGCPDPDGDEDGFADFEDACPKESGGPPDGCPLKDKDGDTVADHLDACPSQREDLDGDQDSDGCPDGVEVAQVRARDDQLWQVARLEVRPGRAATTKAGREALDGLVDAVLTRVSEVSRVRVVGYASVRETSRGRAKALAGKRVELVTRALTEAGVKPDAFEVALYPLREAGERVGRVDVSVFLPLAAALASSGEARATTTASDASASPNESADATMSSGDGPSREATTKPTTTPTDTAKRPSRGDEKAAGDKQASQSPGDKTPDDKTPDDRTPGNKNPDDGRASTEWDAAVLPYPEPSEAPSDEDWDL